MLGWPTIVESFESFPGPLMASEIPVPIRTGLAPLNGHGFPWIVVRNVEDDRSFATSHRLRDLGA